MEYHRPLGREYNFVRQAISGNQWQRTASISVDIYMHITDMNSEKMGKDEMMNLH